ncbi:hypothetical protein IFM89_015291 [Coptis chinensis]|uniref:gibberellin 2beta-dioxygenase n=1 Tax=Coptis chinensis TaxID=261450 RepID=A0A835IPB5_9MAGN|nr:hypothetical protein IFM89_015291 [Coptis chinensis]
MVVASSPTPNRIEKINSFDVPIIDLSCKRSLVSELVVKASEEYGFFKVINHGISKDITDRMEEQGLNFFAKPALEKRQAAPPSPLGYGTKNIGFNGDVGEVEYLLLHTNTQSISQSSKSISNEPLSFHTQLKKKLHVFLFLEKNLDSCVVNDYIEAVRNLACEILELMTEGLHVHDNKCVFSDFIRDIDSDSLVRLNHYPPYKDIMDTSPSSQTNRIGFGEHSDPQILTILRSNDVGGLQILLEDGTWVPVPPDPIAFCVNVGDTLQVLTNGRFKSVIHRALANSVKPRMSIMYFAAPPLHACISPVPNTITPEKSSLYRPFTWSEFKKTAYSLRLGDTRLDLFKAQTDENFA